MYLLIKTVTMVQLWIRGRAEESRDKNHSILCKQRNLKKYKISRKMKINRHRLKKKSNKKLTSLNLERIRQRPIQTQGKRIFNQNLMETCLRKTIHHLEIQHYNFIPKSSNRAITQSWLEQLERRNKLQMNKKNLVSWLQ